MSTNNNRSSNSSTRVWPTAASSHPSSAHSSQLISQQTVSPPAFDQVLVSSTNSPLIASPYEVLSPVSSSEEESSTENSPPHQRQHAATRDEQLAAAALSSDSDGFAEIVVQDIAHEQFDENESQRDEEENEEDEEDDDDGESEPDGDDEFPNLEQFAGSAAHDAAQRSRQLAEFLHRNVSEQLGDDEDDDEDDEDEDSDEEDNEDEELSEEEQNEEEEQEEEEEFTSTPQQAFSSSASSSRVTRIPSSLTSFDPSTSSSSQYDHIRSVLSSDMSSVLTQIRARAAERMAAMQAEREDCAHALTMEDLLGVDNEEGRREREMERDEKIEHEGEQIIASQRFRATRPSPTQRIQPVSLQQFITGNQSRMMDESEEEEEMSEESEEEDEVDEEEEKEEFDDSPPLHSLRQYADSDGNKDNNDNDNDDENDDAFRERAAMMAAEMTDSEEEEVYQRETRARQYETGGAGGRRNHVNDNETAEDEEDEEEEQDELINNFSSLTPDDFISDIDPPPSSFQTTSITTDRFHAYAATQVNRPPQTTARSLASTTAAAPTARPLPSAAAARQGLFIENNPSTRVTNNRTAVPSSTTRAPSSSLFTAQSEALSFLNFSPTQARKLHDQFAREQAFFQQVHENSAAPDSSVYIEQPAGRDQLDPSEFRS